MKPARPARVLLEPVTDGLGVPHNSDDHHVLSVTDLNLSVQDTTGTLTEAQVAPIVEAAVSRVESDIGDAARAVPSDDFDADIRSDGSEVSPEAIETLTK